MEKVKEKNILSKITEIYIIVMVMIFPLCVDSTGFFRILEAKYSYFLSINAIYISAIIITILYYLLFKKTNIFKDMKLHKIQWAVIGFLIINIISTFLSPFFKDYNLLVGVGRGEGLISITLYCLSFLNITMFAEFKKDILELPKLVNEEYTGKSFFIVDDIYATGNTLKAIKHAIEEVGGIIKGEGVIMNIKELNNDMHIYSLLDINET